LVWTPELVMYRTADGKIIGCWRDFHSTLHDELTSRTAQA
jgi:hypothetical protein